MQIPVVLMGANYYTGLGAIRTLGRRGVAVYALDYYFPNAYALYSRYTSRKILCPDINKDEKVVADFLIELGKELPTRAVLMASADSYALLICRYSEALKPYYIFPEMPPGLHERIINKKGLSEIAREHNLNAPLTHIADPAADLEAIAGSMPYPCIIKPSLSHKFVKVFRQKCLFANNRKELLAALEKARERELEVMVQEIIPGFDDQMYVFDAYINAGGRATHTFCGQKLRQFPINFGSSTLTHQVYDEQLIEIGLDYMKRIGYRGFGEIEFKKDPASGEYKLIEINARLSTLNILFDKCGVEFTYVIYRDLIGDPLPDYHLREEKPWAFWHAYEDIFSVSAYLKKKQLTVGQVLKPWLHHKKAFAVWAADDIRPAFVFALMILRKAAGKLRRLAFGARDS